MRTSKPDTINTSYFLKHPKDRGLVLDFEETAKTLPNNTGNHYIAVLDQRISSSTYPYSKRQSFEKHRAIDAETHIVALYDDGPQEELPDITNNAMRIKKPETMHISLPDIFDFTLSRIYISALDALKLYGAETFKKTEMWFIVQRTDVAPGQCHRPHISNWHNHISSGENTDLTYLFHNLLGTENRLIRHKGQKIQTLELIIPDGAISRLGGEIDHRPQQNNLNTVLRRLWGGLIIKLEQEQTSRNANNRAENTVMINRNDPMFKRFKDAAEHILKYDTRIHTLDSPQTLIEYSGTNVEYV